jgi:hypothetical protein
VLQNQLVDLDAVTAQARFRGFQARLRHAEAFETERFAWDLHASARAEPDADRTVSDIEYARSAGR